MAFFGEKPKQAAVNDSLFAIRVKAPFRNADKYKFALLACLSDVQ